MPFPQSTRSSYLHVSCGSKNPATTPLSSPIFQGIVPRAKESPGGIYSNEKDREAADDWIRDNMPDPDQCSLEDSEEAGSTESYFFLRHSDSATVVYKVAVKDGRRGERSQAYGARSRPSERVAGEATVFRPERGINGRDWRFQARRRETGIRDRR